MLDHERAFGKLGNRINQATRLKNLGNVFWNARKERSLARVELARFFVYFFEALSARNYFLVNNCDPLAHVLAKVGF